MLGMMQALRYNDPDAGTRLPTSVGLRRPDPIRASTALPGRTRQQKLTMRERNIMQLPIRQVVDTAISLDDCFYETDGLGAEAGELIESVKELVTEFSFESMSRDTPMNERMTGADMQIAEKLDDLLQTLRSEAERLFDNLRNRIRVSAEWWLPAGTPLASCQTTDARMVIELQDLKYQAPEFFAEDVAELDRFVGTCALVLFGNSATNHDLAPVDFTRFESLEMLGLAGNSLAQLPDGIATSDTLRYLDLKDNPYLILDSNLAADWNTPQLEVLNLERCEPGDGFIATLTQKHPDLHVPS